MNIRIITKPITRAEAKEIGKDFYRDMIKGAADIERGIIALGGEWHIDANNVLTEDGSKQSDIWGFNIYPDKVGAERLEYVALINIRPAAGNFDMYIKDKKIREKIRVLVEKFVL
jgi:hypothetical protein